MTNICYKNQNKTIKLKLPKILNFFILCCKGMFCFRGPSREATLINSFYKVESPEGFALLKLFLAYKSFSNLIGFCTYMNFKVKLGINVHNGIPICTI